MSNIYNLYWYIFQSVFALITITSILLTILVFVMTKDKSKKGIVFIVWLISLSNLLSILFISFFSGILYDELAIPTDMLLLILMFTSIIAFIIGTILFLVNIFNKSSS